MRPEHRKVVSIGADAELLSLRHAVLQSAGFDVVTTENETDALASIRRGSVVYCWCATRFFWFSGND